MRFNYIKILLLVGLVLHCTPFVRGTYVCLEYLLAQFLHVEDGLSNIKNIWPEFIILPYKR
jgi:hypothetical protein